MAVGVGAKYLPVLVVLPAGPASVSSTAEVPDVLLKDATVWLNRVESVADTAGAAAAHTSTLRTRRIAKSKQSIALNFARYSESKPKQTRGEMLTTTSFL